MIEWGFALAGIRRQEIAENRKISECDVDETKTIEQGVLVKLVADV